MKKRRNEIEEEVRDEGLATKLDSSNKGFNMLAKMGYKPGKDEGFLFLGTFSKTYVMQLPFENYSGLLLVVVD